MARGNRVCGLVALAVAAIVAWEVRTLAVLTAGVPGPGLLPLLASGVMAVCGLGLLLSRPGGGKTVAWPPADVRPKVYGSAAALCAYVWLAPLGGFLLATMVLTAVLSGWWGGYRWWVAGLFGALAGAAMFVLFDVVLGVPLPRGMWD